MQRFLSSYTVLRRVVTVNVLPLILDGATVTFGILGHLIFEQRFADSKLVFGELEPARGITKAFTAIA